MRKSKFTTDQQRAILAEWDGGASIDDLVRKHQISPATLYKWKKAHAIEADDTARELKELREQNVRLKKMFAELSMDHGILQEGYDMLKKWQAQDAKKK